MPSSVGCMILASNPGLVPIIRQRIVSAHAFGLNSPGSTEICNRWHRLAIEELCKCRLNQSATDLPVPFGRHTLQSPLTHCVR